MKHKMMLFNVLIVLLLALTACGSAERNEEATSTPLSTNPTAMTGETPTVEMTSEATSTESSVSPTSTEMAPSTTETAIVPVTGGETLLGVSQNDTKGPYLVDAKGMTVYVYTKDTQNGTTSACTGDCATTWPPVTMSGTSAAGTPASGTAEAGTPAVGSGTAVSGTSVAETPTSTTGTGGATSGTAVAGTPGAGTAVAGTPMAGNAIDPSLIGSITLPDGTVQLTYNGWPLYHNAQDLAPGDINGQGMEDSWYLISPSGDPIKTK